MAEPTLTRVPFWRDARVLTILTQIVFVVVVELVAGFLYANVSTAMRQRGLVSDLKFLDLEAGFEIGEALIPYQASDNYRQALLAGFSNTLFVSIVGIILSTILGVAVGVARLSTNWLISQIAGAYIELIRNTPLLVQLFFIYFGVFVTLPSIGQSLEFPGSIYANQRGVFVPRPVPTETFAIWVWFIVGAILLAFALNYFSARAPKLRLNWLALVALIGLPALGWLIAGNPVSFDLPVRERFNFRGGVGLSPEFSALLAGLVLYTAGFIAEVVRAGILAVRRGQIEAAYSLGFNGGQVLRMIIFPQALRVIVPPLTSQYLNLAKNSSLAIAIGFPDLFSVATTSANQTGQPVPVYLLVMATYLAMSLFTSLLMNLYNRRVQILEK